MAAHGHVEVEVKMLKNYGGPWTCINKQLWSETDNSIVVPLLGILFSVEFSNLLKRLGGLNQKPRLQLSEN